MSHLSRRRPLSPSKEEEIPEELASWLKKNGLHLNSNGGVSFQSKRPVTITTYPFEEALNESNIPILRLLWEHAHPHPRDKQHYCRLLFFKAAIRGQVHGLKWLYEEVGEIEVDGINEVGYTALALACINRNMGCCKYLVSIGADLKFCATIRGTPFMRACIDGDFVMMKWIFSGMRLVGPVCFMI